LTKKGASLRCSNDGGSQGSWVRIPPGPPIKRVFIPFTLLTRPSGKRVGRGHRRPGMEGRRDRDNPLGTDRQTLLNQGGRQNGGAVVRSEDEGFTSEANRHGGFRDCHSLIYHPRTGDGPTNTLDSPQSFVGPFREGALGPEFGFKTSYVPHRQERLDIGQINRYVLSR